MISALQDRFWVCRRKRNLHPRIIKHLDSFLYFLNDELGVDGYVI